MLEHEMRYRQNLNSDQSIVIPGSDQLVAQLGFDPSGQAPAPAPHRRRPVGISRLCAGARIEDDRIEPACAVDFLCRLAP